MFRQCHRLNGHKSEQILGDSGGQRSLMCCSPWGPKEPDTTEQLTLSLSLKKQKKFHQLGIYSESLWYLLKWGVSGRRALSLLKDPDGVHVSMLPCSYSTLSSPTPCCDHKSVLNVYMSIAALQIHSTICKIDGQWEFAVWFRELNPGLCDNLEEWDGDGGGREVQEGGDHVYTYGWFMFMYGRHQHIF